MKSFLKKLYGIFFFMCMFLFIPSIDADIISIKDLSYGSTNEKISFNGVLNDYNTFFSKTTHSFPNQEELFIDKRLLTQNDYKVRMNFDVEAGNKYNADINDNEKYDVLVYLFSWDTGEYETYTVYENTLLGSEIKSSKFLELDLSKVRMHGIYSISVDMEGQDSGDWLDFQWIVDGYDYRYNDIYIGDIYGFEVNVTSNNNFGISSDGRSIYLKNIFDYYTSFSYSFKLTQKNENESYSLELVKCIVNGDWDYYNLYDSEKDSCSVIGNEEDVSLNTEYFKTNVTSLDDYKKDSYLVFNIYSGNSLIKSHYISFNTLYEAQVEFIEDLSIIDQTGHDVLSDGISYSEVINIYVDGINFKDDAKYEMNIPVYDMDDEYVDGRYYTFTGKELNDGDVH